MLCYVLKLSHTNPNMNTFQHANAKNVDHPQLAASREEVREKSCPQTDGEGEKKEGGRIVTPKFFSELRSLPLVGWGGREKAAENDPPGML